VISELMKQLLLNAIDLWRLYGFERVRNAA